MQPIAIIGAACRFPGASGLDEFWQLLREGRSAIATVPRDRWDPDTFCDPNPNAPGKMVSRYGGFVKNLKEFDHAFFGISPREATSMDPQQRMLLETAWEAFEDAGQPMELLSGSKTAVYVGIGPGDYSRLCMQPVDQIDAYLTTGNFLSVAADRIAYFFDLRGPSLAVDTACSSSLVCVHLACRSIDCGEATMALAGGVNALISPPISISLSKAGAISPTGQCRAFDGQANGYVRGEGSGFVVLKQLDRAMADGDRIYGVIRGSAINQSGRRNGLTAPGSWGEEAVMLSAWQASGIPPTEASYVEAHGTGTVLGDAIEAGALGRVFGTGRNGHGPCRIGSVKTNIGHLETAAGIAGLIKVLLMMSHGELVGSLYPEVPNPHVNLETLGLKVQRRFEPWSAATSRRVAGVSSFGLGGTYAHVCVTAPDAPPEPDLQQAPANKFLVPVSARHPDALRQLVRESSQCFDKADERLAVAMCRAAGRRRSHHDYRVAFTGASAAEVALSMEWWLQNSQNAPFKVGARRKLVAVIGPSTFGSEEIVKAVSDFGLDSADIEIACRNLGDRGLLAPLAMLAILNHWGVQPTIVLRQTADGKFTDLTNDVPSHMQRYYLCKELGNAGDDFLDLTGKDALAALPPLARNGRVISGFTSPDDAMLTALRIAGELYELGYPLEWQNIYPGNVKHVSLPRYPWQQKTCWWSSAEAAQPISQPSSNPPTQRHLAIPANGDLRVLLARVTGRPIQEIQPDASPSDLGIDSLMTIDLQNELDKEFGVKVSVETLVGAASVSELEQLIKEVQKDAPTLVVPVVQPQRVSRHGSSTEIREATIADYEEVAALSARNGLSVRPREDWEHLWADNPLCKRFPEWPSGWIVQDRDMVVGYLGCIPVSAVFKGREVLGASIHSFSLDPAHRGQGLLLLKRMMELGNGVEYWLGNTANANSSKVLSRSKIPRVPAGDWENAAFWITNYTGFVESALARKGWSEVWAYPLSAALKLRNVLRPRSWIRQGCTLKVHSDFDGRFDVFWQDLQGMYPNRFLTTRSREMLQWHFHYSLLDGNTWVVTREGDARIVSYAIFQRCDNQELGLKRVRLVDFQTLDQDSETLTSMLAWAIQKCREQGVHMLECFGFRPEKQTIIDGKAPHKRQLGSWSYFYSATDNLAQELQEPSVWDPSLFDGDASL